MKTEMAGSFGTMVPIRLHGVTSRKTNLEIYMFTVKNEWFKPNKPLLNIYKTNPIKLVANNKQIANAQIIKIKKKKILLVQIDNCQN